MQHSPWQPVLENGSHRLAFHWQPQAPAGDALLSDPRPAPPRPSKPFLSTYDGPILTGLARGGLLASLGWPSWWWTGLQGREALRMWASLSGSGDREGTVLGQGSQASSRTWSGRGPASTS